jgi:glycosyltransferase involved in cell wall biosynthesis
MLVGDWYTVQRVPSACARAARAASRCSQRTMLFALLAASVALACVSIIVTLSGRAAADSPGNDSAAGPPERPMSISSEHASSYLCCDNDSPWRCVTGNERPAYGELRRLDLVPHHPAVQGEGGKGGSPSSSSLRSLRSQQLRIGFVTYATGPYNSFAEDLWESIQHHAFPGHEVHLFLFTDRAGDNNFLPHSRVHKRQQSRLGWPFDSLGRHFLYLNESEWFAGMDYLLAIDSDAIVVGPLDELMLGDRIATLQAWSFGHARVDFAYDKRVTPADAPYTAGFIGADEGLCYFCGGLFGGTLEGFLDILESTVSLARRDLQGSPARVALWHDESYLNRVFIDKPPSVVLAPNFMYPEPPVDEWLFVQGNKDGKMAWTMRGGGRRFRHKIYNLGVRKHVDAQVHEFQPLTATIPAIMSGSGEAEPFPLPLLRVDVSSRVTFLVKSFERPACLTRLLDSIEKSYPGFSVIVLDDSASPLLTQANLDKYSSLHITYLPAETDIGLSEGRNRLVDAASTPYILLLDDDFILRDDEVKGTGNGQSGGKLAALVSALEFGGFDMVGGCVDSTQGSAWSYGLGRYSGILQQRADVPCRANDGETPRSPDFVTDELACWKVDMILNFFLARVKFLQRVRWDPILKVGEHEDFFLRAKDAGGRVAMCRGFVAENDNTCDATPAYKAKRRRVFDYWVHMFRKHKLSRMETAAGSYTLQCLGGAEAADSDCSIDVKQENVWFE